MFDVEREIKKLEDECELKKGIIRAIEPFSEHVKNIDSTNVVYTKDSKYDNNMQILREAARLYGKYELQYYYMNGNCLALMYRFDDFRIQLFCTDAECALEKVSNGKCKIVESSQTQRMVSCDLGGDV